MDLVELGQLTDQEWTDLIDGEHEPFGPVGASLAWRPKDRHVALQGPDGRLVAAAGAVVATLKIEGARRLEVVGIGSVMVTRSLRGQGLMSRLVAPLRRLAEGMGPDRAMLFCRPELVELYRGLGFAEITAPVWADQPRGRIEMPLVAMWQSLRPGAEWPPGRVDVCGLPF